MRVGIRAGVFFTLIFGLALSLEGTLHADPYSASGYSDGGSDYSPYSGSYSNRYQSYGRFGGGGSSSRFAPVISLDLNVQDHLDSSFRIAIRENRMDDAKALLEKGANPAVASDTGRTSLMYAARNCSIPAVELILTREVRVNDADRQGKTALMYAAMQVCDGVVVRLLRIPGIQLDLKDKEGKTAWNYAREGGLLDYGGSAERIIHRLNPAFAQKKAGLEKS